MATLCAVLGPRAFPYLPRFFPSILDALEWEVQGSESQDVPNAPEVSDTPQMATDERQESRGKYGLLWTSALAAVGTIAASLPTFLSPYLRRILAVVLRPSGFLEDEGGGAGAIAVKKEAADRVLSLIAVGVESRLLIPAVCDSYDGCVRVEDTPAGEGRSARLVARLLTYVQEVRAFPTLIRREFYFDSPFHHVVALAGFCTYAENPIRPVPKMASRRICSYSLYS